MTHDGEELRAQLEAYAAPGEPKDDFPAHLYPRLLRDLKGILDALITRVEELEGAFKKKCDFDMISTTALEQILTRIRALERAVESSGTPLGVVDLPPPVVDSPGPIPEEGDDLDDSDVDLRPDKAH